MGMGETSTGITGQIELTTPPEAPLTQDIGTTGTPASKMRSIEGVMKLFPKWKSYPPGDVMNFIDNQASTYGKYISEIFDCENFAYLAAADVRRKFPGIRIAVLLGYGKYGGPNIVDKEHAVNVLWIEEDAGDGKKVWVPRFYDATLHEEITNKADPPFKTEVVISIPILGSSDKNDYSELAPFENFNFLKTATFALDRTTYDFDSIADIKNKLTNWISTGYGQSGLGEIETALYTPNDMVFLYYAHIIEWYAHHRTPQPPTKAAPVGVAFGKIGNDDYAALLLWKSEKEYELWDIYAGAEINQTLKSSGLKFKARVVLV
jgi:hypothetical protein